MKISKICALVLTLAMILPFVVACGSTQEGTPVSFPSVTIISTYDPNASDAGDEAATGEAAAEPGFEDEIYAGEVVVYVETETSEITVLDVIQAYGEAKNVSVVYEESNNRITKIGELSAGGGYFWNFLVNGKDSSLGTAVTPEDEIQVILTK